VRLNLNEMSQTTVPVDQQTHPAISNNAQQYTSRRHVLVVWRVTSAYQDSVLISCCFGYQCLSKNRSARSLSGFSWHRDHSTCFAAAIGQPHKI
jgi:hypothetical protein